MKNKKVEEVLVVSPIFEKVKDLRQRYRALRLTIKKIRQFTEGKIKRRVEC